MEIKVILEAGDSLKELMNNLASALNPKSKSEVIEVKETKKKTKEVIDVEVQPQPIDYAAIRNEIKFIGSKKRADGKDVISVLNKYGGKLKACPDEQLADLKAELEAL